MLCCHVAAYQLCKRCSLIFYYYWRVFLYSVKLNFPSKMSINLLGNHFTFISCGFLRLLGMKVEFFKVQVLLDSRWPHSHLAKWIKLSWVNMFRNALNCSKRAFYSIERSFSQWLPTGPFTAKPTPPFLPKKTVQRGFLCQTCQVSKSKLFPVMTFRERCNDNVSLNVSRQKKSLFKKIRENHVFFPISVNESYVEIVVV